MDYYDIRDWVRGTLSPERRREVGRYILGSTDPELQATLQELIWEYETEPERQRQDNREPWEGTSTSP